MRIEANSASRPDISHAWEIAVFMLTAVRHSADKPLDSGNVGSRIDQASSHDEASDAKPGNEGACGPQRRHERAKALVRRAETRSELDSDHG